MKAFITGFVRSGNTYTANGAAELIKEIVAHIKTDDLEILFRMDSGYFDDDIIETIESAGCKYLIKGKEYPTLASQVTDPYISFTKGDEGRETTELVTKLDTLDKDRRFVVSRVLKPEKDRAQLSFLEGDEFADLLCDPYRTAFRKSGHCLREALFERKTRQCRKLHQGSQI